MCPGKAGGDDGPHSSAGGILLTIGEEPKVTGDMGSRRDDVGFTESCAPGVLGVDLDLGAADDQARVKGQVLFVAQFFAESIENAGSFIDSAVPGGIGKDPCGVAGLCGDVEDPAACAAAGGCHGVESFCCLEGQGDIASPRAFDEIMSCHGG